MRGGGSQHPVRCASSRNTAAADAAEQQERAEKLSRWVRTKPRRPPHRLTVTLEARLHQQPASTRISEVRVTDTAGLQAIDRVSAASAALAGTLAAGLSSRLL